MKHLGKIAFWHRVGDAEGFGLVRRAAVGAEDQVHERRDVGVVAGFAFAGVVPVVKLGRADEQPQRPDGQAHV